MEGCFVTRQDQDSAATGSLVEVTRGRQESSVLTWLLAAVGSHVQWQSKFVFCTLLYL